MRDCVGTYSRCGHERAYWKTHDNLLAVKTTSNYAEKTVIIKINIEWNDIYNSNLYLETIERKIII